MNYFKKQNNAKNLFDVPKGGIVCFNGTECDIHTLVTRMHIRKIAEDSPYEGGSLACECIFQTGSKQTAYCKGEEVFALWNALGPVIDVQDNGLREYFQNIDLSGKALPSLEQVFSRFVQPPQNKTAQIDRYGNMISKKFKSMKQANSFILQDILNLKNLGHSASSKVEIEKYLYIR